MNLPITPFNYFNFTAIAIALSMLTSSCGGGSASGSGGDGFQQTSQQSLQQPLNNDSNQVVSTTELEPGGALANDGTWSLEDRLFISGGERSRTQSNRSNLATIIVGGGVF